MSRLAAVLVLMALASCKEKPKPPPVTPAARGAAFFAAVADRFGEVVLADLKATKGAWYKDYLQQTGARDDAELQRKMQIGKGILDQYPGSFALTEAQEAALKAGTFADEENLKKVKAAGVRFEQGGRGIPDAHRVAIALALSGGWGKGIELEFVARLVQNPPAKP